MSRSFLANIPIAKLDYSWYTNKDVGLFPFNFYCGDVTIDISDKMKGKNQKLQNQFRILHQKTFTFMAIIQANCYRKIALLYTCTLWMNSICLSPTNYTDHCNSANSLDAWILRQCPSVPIPKVLGSMLTN